MSSDSGPSDISIPIPIKVYVTTDDGELVQPALAGNNAGVIALAKRVLETFRAHLLRRSEDGSPSKSLRIYVESLAEVHGSLDPTMGWPLPTLDEVSEYLSNSFPAIWLGGGQQGLFNEPYWATVNPKQAGHMLLWIEIFKLLECRASNVTYRESGMELDYDHAYHLVVTIAAHELMHCLVHSFFGPNLTPLGVGPVSYDKKSGAASGENGWRLEWALFGGSLNIHWEEDEVRRWRLSHLQDISFRPNDSEIAYSISSHSLMTSHVITLAIKRDSEIPHISPRLLDLPVTRKVSGTRHRVEGSVRNPPSPSRLEPTPQPRRPNSSSIPDTLTHSPGLRHRY